MDDPALTLRPLKTKCLPASFLDTIFIERLGRSLKQDAICLEEISDGFQAPRIIKNWMTFYNTKRLHSALDR